jgi:hypothetical protein
MIVNKTGEYMKKTGNIKNRTVLWFTLGFLLVFFIGFLWYFIVMYSFFNHPIKSSDIPGYITTTEDFQQRMKESLDVPQIRDWLNTLSESEIKQLQNQRFQAIAFPKQLPNSVNNLKREMSYITIIKDNKYGICMRISWGGPIARWGVFVGPKEMTIPETELKLTDLYD